MKKGLYKDFKKEIRCNMGRFLSILLIVALGVAFFSGIRSSEPDMRLSADRYFDREDLMDLSIIGDKGITADDLEIIKKLPDVKEAYPRYRIDGLLKNGDRYDVIRIYSLLKEMNKVEILEGQMPKKETECLLDADYMKERKLKIGDTVMVRGGGDEKISESLDNDTFVIVGSCVSPEYISFGRGASRIGSGEVAGFMFIERAVFDMPVYSEICIEAKNAKSQVAFTPEYGEKVDKAEKDVKSIEKERCLLREKDLREKANQKITEERDKLREKDKEAKIKFAEAEKELQDGEAKIQEAEKELNDGRTEIQNGEKTLDEKTRLLNAKEKTLKDSETRLNEKEKMLREGRKTLQNKKNTLLNGEKLLEEERLNVNKIFEEERKKIDDGLLQIESAKKRLEILKNSENLSPEEIAEMQQLEEIIKNEAKLMESKAVLEEKEKQAEAKFEKEEDKISAGKEKLLAEEKKLSEGETQIEQGRRAIKEGRVQISDGRTAIEKVRRDLSAHKAEIAVASAELNRKHEDLKSGQEALEKEKTETFEKIQDGFERLESEQEKLDRKDLSAKWYVSDRGALPEYTGYGDNADRMGAVGRVFPVLFFLVAALISLTTMTRLVEEERMQIGTLKALGYRKTDIAGKYIWYAFLATFIGSVLGVLFGEKIFPGVIVSSYKIIYPHIPDGVYPYHMSFAVLAGGVALLCTLGGAGIASWHSLRAEPAELMRPPVPKAGKRIFLERIPFLWSRMSFTWKATFRNLMRYKKRFFMTVFGIGGCMALMLVGYGIRDSITDVKEKQYTELIKYDAAVFLDDTATDYDRKKIRELLRDDKDVKETTSLFLKKGTVKKGKNKREVYISVVKNDKTLKDFITLRKRKTPNKKVDIPEEGVILSEKLAKVLKVKQGEHVTIQNKKVPVTGIFENYAGHFAYMSEETYESVTGEKPVKNLVYIKTDKNDLKKVGKKFLLLDGVLNVSYKDTQEEQMTDMLSVMDLVIFILILAAGGLAFVVLYNLNNINIAERKRELATIKVLGFYDREVAAYVYRENILLTIIGSAIGCGMGAALHRYVIGTVEVDKAMFGRNINLSSYGYSLLFTILFTVVVGIVTYFKLKNIDMASSLKSIE